MQPSHIVSFHSCITPHCSVVTSPCPIIWQHIDCCVPLRHVVLLHQPITLFHHIYVRHLIDCCVLLSGVLLEDEAAVVKMNIYLRNFYYQPWQWRGCTQKNKPQYVDCSYPQENVALLIEGFARCTKKRMAPHDDHLPLSSEGERQAAYRSMAVAEEGDKVGGAAVGGRQ
jgi:hypothetical protein